MIFHKKDDNSPKEKKEELGWRERRSQSSDDVEITDLNDNDDKVFSLDLKQPTNKSLFFLQVVDAEATSPAMDATCETCSGAKTSLERLEALGHELDDLKKALNAATGQAGNVFDVVFAPPPPTPPAPVVAPQNVD